MKKIIAFFLAGMFALALAACNGDTPTTTGGDPTQPPTQSIPGSGGTPTQNEIYFAPNGVRLEIGALPAPALESLGEPVDTFESQSCAMNAKDVNYRYDGFVLTVTYPEQGEDYISSIKLTGDKYTIPGGITIGSAPDAAFAAYGTADREDGSFYYFARGICILNIKIENDKVSQIIFEYDWDNA